MAAYVRLADGRHTGLEFTTTSSAVTCEPTRTGFGTDTVTVEVFLGEASLGDATAKVSVMDLTASIVPRKVSIFPHESIGLTAKLEDTAPPGPYKYRWRTAVGVDGLDGPEVQRNDRRVHGEISVNRVTR